MCLTSDDFLQACLDNFNPETWRARTEVDFDENICVWQPTDALDEKTIQEYVDFAMNEHGYSVEQGIFLF